MNALRHALAQAGAGYWLRDSRVPACLTDAGGDGLRRLDLRIEAGRIAALEPAGTAPDGPSLDGGQVWPGFVDAHTHLDKGHIWPRAPTPDGTVAARAWRSWAIVPPGRSTTCARARISRCAARMRTAPSRYGRIWTAMCRTRRTPGRCSPRCARPGPGGSRCRLPRS